MACGFQEQSFANQIEHLESLLLSHVSDGLGVVVAEGGLGHEQLDADQREVNQLVQEELAKTSDKPVLKFR